MDQHQEGEDVLMGPGHQHALMEILHHVKMELLFHHVLMKTNEHVLREQLQCVMMELLKNETSCCDFNKQDLILNFGQTYIINETINQPILTISHF